MAILSREDAQALLKKVLLFSKADECAVALNGTEGGNIRYARNAISTSGDISTFSLSERLKVLMSPEVEMALRAYLMLPPSVPLRATAHSSAFEKSRTFFSRACASSLDKIAIAYSLNFSCCI